MKNLILFIFLAFTIMGLLSPITSDSFATKDDNNGKAMGCEKANDNSKTREKNPHCSTNTILCDPNGDGAIDASELADYLISQGIDSTQALDISISLISTAERIDTVNDDNNFIDTFSELSELNSRLMGASLDTCPAF